MRDTIVNFVTRSSTFLINFQIIKPVHTLNWLSLNELFSAKIETCSAFRKRGKTKWKLNCHCLINVKRTSQLHWPIDSKQGCAQNIFFIFWWVQIFLLLSGMSRATCGVIENIVNLIHCSFCVTTDPYCQLITSLEGRTSFFGENDILFAVFPLVEIKLSIEFLKHY